MKKTKKGILADTYPTDVGGEGGHHEPDDKENRADQPVSTGGGGMDSGGGSEVGPDIGGSDRDPNS